MAVLPMMTRRRWAEVMAFMALFAAGPAFAQDLSPINTFFTTLGTALTGATGRAIGLVAVAAVGFSALFGRMNWALAGSVFLGLVIIYGAAVILAGL